MKINLAIIGAGRIGHVHAEAINKNINDKPKNWKNRSGKIRFAKKHHKKPNY